MKEKLSVITPKKLGRVLGHNYANIYALGENEQSNAKDPQKVKCGKEIKAKMEKEAHLTGGGARKETVSNYCWCMNL